MIWTTDTYAFVIAALRKSNSVTKTCKELSVQWREEVSPKAVDCAFRRAKLGLPTQYLASGTDSTGESNVRKKWDDALIKQCIPVLKRHGTVVEACREISDLAGRPVTASALQKAFKASNKKKPSAYVDKKLQAEYFRKHAAEARQGKRRQQVQGFNVPAAIRSREPMGPVSGHVSEEEKQDHLEIVRLVQKGKGSVEALADALDCAPKEARRRIDAAAAAGYNVRWHGESAAVAEARPLEPGEAQQINWDGKERCIAMISDTHAGSKWAALEEQAAFIDYAYKCGAREVLHSGDVLDGEYGAKRGSHFLQNSVGYDAQAQAALDSFPQHSGLRYLFCGGNHDETMSKLIGLDPVRSMVSGSGRADMVYLGFPLGRLVYGDDPETMLKIELIHPKSAAAYAASWPLQKFVERMQGGSKPHILQMGHYHSHVSGFFRGIYCVMPGCWQYQTSYEATQGLEPAVGGVLIWVRREGRSFKIRQEWCAAHQKDVTWFTAGTVG